MTEPFTGSEWDDFVKHVNDDLIPKIDGSALGISLVPDGPTDVKFAVELGFLVMMDKPIIAIVAPGVAVPAKLRAVADVIVTGHPDDPDFQAKFQRALAKFIPTEVTDG